MNNTFPESRKKGSFSRTEKNRSSECHPCCQKLPSALPEKKKVSKSSWAIPEMPMGTKPAVSETTNKVIAFHWHSLPLCQKCKEDDLPHKLLATFAPPEVTSSLFIFSFWTLGKVYQSDSACQKFVHLGTGTVTNACREEKRISVFLSVVPSLEMFPETWKAGCAEKLIKSLTLKLKVSVNH